MRRSESRLDDDSPVSAFLRDGVVAAGAVISRNPVIVGGTTAFLVTLFYVSANALWNQPQPHASAFFITRDMTHYAMPMPSDDVGGDDIEGDEEAIAPGAAAKPPVPADPVVQQVQDILGDLNLYTGSVDGIAGPQTKKAIEEYQRLVGLDVSGEIDGRLLDELMARRAPQAEPMPPAPAPRPVVAPSSAPAARQVFGLAMPQEDVVKIQAGLKAFGHDAIEIDGKLGLQTKSAIREFQSLFGLPVTGEPNDVLLAKMREIGLTN